MATPHGGPLDDPAKLLRLYRAELKRQFYRNCLGCFGASMVLTLLSPTLTIALMGTGFWLALLLIEAKEAFNRSPNADSSRFQRWQSRQLWVAAKSGDRQSLERLQKLP